MPSAVVNGSCDWGLIGRKLGLVVGLVGLDRGDGGGGGFGEL